MGGLEGRRGRAQQTRASGGFIRGRDGQGRRRGGLSDLPGRRSAPTGLGARWKRRAARARGPEEATGETWENGDLRLAGGVARRWEATQETGDEGVTRAASFWLRPGSLTLWVGRWGGCTACARWGSSPGGPRNRTPGAASFHPSAPGGPPGILALPVLVTLRVTGSQARAESCCRVTCL